MYIRELNQQIIEDSKRLCKTVILNNIALSYITQNKQINHHIYDLVFIGYDQLKETIVPFKLSIVSSMHSKEDNEFIDNLPVNIDTHKNMAMSAKAIQQKIKETGLLAADMVGEMDKFYFVTYGCIPDLYRESRYRVTRMMIHYSAYYQFVLFISKFLKHECDLNIFSGSKYNNMKYITIEDMKLNASTIVIEKDHSLIHTHYTFGCGPKQYNVIKTVKTYRCDIPLKEPVDKNIFMASYYKDPKLSNIIFEYMDYCLDKVLLYVEESKDNIMVIVLPREIFLNTNFGECDECRGILNVTKEEENG